MQTLYKKTGHQTLDQSCCDTNNFKIMTALILPPAVTDCQILFIRQFMHMKMHRRVESVVDATPGTMYKNMASETDCWTDCDQMS